MNPDKYIFAPKATSEETLEALIELLVADGLDEDDLTNKALSTRNHEIHSLAVMLYITGVEMGRIPNGFDHSDAIYLDIAKTHIAKLGPQDPMSIMFRIYDEHANKPKVSTRTWQDAEIENLGINDLEVGMNHLFDAYFDYVSSTIDLHPETLSLLKKASEEFAATESTKAAIMGASDADGVLAIDDYDGNIIGTIAATVDELKKTGIQPQQVYDSQSQFQQAGETYAKFVTPIVEFELAHNSNVAIMRAAATNNTELMQHVLSGIQQFKGLDPLGVALQVFKKAIFDPKI